MKVRAAAAADGPEIGRLFGAGFVEDPVLSWVFAGPDCRQRLEGMFTFHVGETFLPADHVYLLDGAAAAWLPPNRSRPDDDGFGARFAAALTAVGTTAEEFGRLAAFGEVARSAHPTEPHWYLGVIATWPDQRGQGLGSALLEHCLAIVDASSMPAYLESTNPRNLTLYERHGFESLGRRDIPDGPFVTPMWRLPR